MAVAGGPDESTSPRFPALHRHHRPPSSAEVLLSSATSSSSLDTSDREDGDDPREEHFGARGRAVMPMHFRSRIGIHGGGGRTGREQEGAGNETDVEDEDGEADDSPTTGEDSAGNLGDVRCTSVAG
jgi:hypothetical protein